MANDFGVSTPTTFAAFSVALVVSALLGPAPRMSYGSIAFERPH
ncbi:hypothetical protein [Cupriavidus pauculus]|nr:hypothetical protein [Cupriavidus pauculus]GJG94380.1 hypothetical protein CBA19C6_07845 [Cupriavidus pauculus]